MDLFLRLQKVVQESRLDIMTANIRVIDILKLVTASNKSGLELLKGIIRILNDADNRFGRKKATDRNILSITHIFHERFHIFYGLHFFAKNKNEFGGI